METEAIGRVLAGEAEAFRMILERYRKPVLSFIYNMLGTRENVEDVGQEVFLKAYHGLAGFDPSRGAAFSTWLFAIARNACVDFRRKSGRHEALDAGALREALADAADAGPGMETKARLDQALASLPEDQRLAVEWVFIRGMSYEEAARLEEVSVGTLSSRLARAKGRLQRSLRGGEEA